MYSNACQYFEFSSILVILCPCIILVPLICGEEALLCTFTRWCQSTFLIRPLLMWLEQKPCLLLENSALKDKLRGATDLHC